MPEDMRRLIYGHSGFSLGVLYRIIDEYFTNNIEYNPYIIPASISFSIFFSI